MKLRFVVVAGLGLVTGACVPKNGRLEINRFQHEEYPYAVFYAPDGNPVTPLGGNWQVDNFAIQPGANGYVPKQSPEYVRDRNYDTNGDGSPDVVVQEPVNDLLLKNSQVDASMWVRTVAVVPEHKDRELAASAERYVERASRTGEFPVGLADDGALDAKSPLYASRVLHGEACTLSKRQAYRIDFELADAAQVTAQTAWRRHTVVFVRTGYGHRVNRPDGVAYTDYPVLMLVGLSAKPQDFTSIEGDFERLLKQTVLGEPGKGLSMNGGTTCTLSSAEATSGGEAAPPGPDLNEAAQVPLAPEALPQP